jgi:hypothetical protein
MPRVALQSHAARASAQSRQSIDTHTAAHVDLNCRSPTPTLDLPTFWSPRTKVAAALCARLGGRPVPLLRSAGNDGKSVRKLAKKVRSDLGDGSS